MADTEPVVYMERLYVCVLKPLDVLANIRRITRITTFSKETNKCYSTKEGTCQLGRPHGNCCKLCLQCKVNVF